MPYLGIEGPNRVAATGIAGYVYTVQYSSNLPVWTSYGQSHYGRGTGEQWLVNQENTSPYFCRILATNFSESATASVGAVTILHYPEPATTARAWTVALYLVNTRGLVTNEVNTPRLEWYAPEKLGDLYFRDPWGANAFLKEISGGQACLAGTVIGWMEEPEQDLYPSNITLNTDYYFGLADPYVWYTNYDVHVMHALVKNSGQQTGWLYPEQSFHTPQGHIVNIGIDWMINADVFELAPLLYSNWSSDDAILPTAPWIHEFLHTIGLNGHANSYDCGTNVISLSTTNNPIQGYGNPFSVMGERAYATHPDARMKLRLGWIASNQIQSITSDGTYLIYPLELCDGQVKALSVPVAPPITNNNHTFAFDHFLLEYRRPIGFDRYLARLDGSTFLSTYKPSGTVTNNGILVFMEYPPSAGTDSTLLLDMNPGTSYDPDRGIKIPGNAGKFADAMLNVDQTFTWEGLSVTPLGTNAAGAMQVAIDLP